MSKNTQLRWISFGLLLLAVIIFIAALAFPTSESGEGAGMMIFIRILIALCLDAALILAATVLAALSLKNNSGGGTVASGFLLFFGILFLLPLLILAIKMIL